MRINWRNIELDRAIPGVIITVIMLAGMWFSRAEATEKSTPPTEATATATQTVTAGGGHGGGASNQLSEHTTAVAIGTTAPAPLHATPQCYLPPKGIRRVRQALFGVVTLDPLLVRNADCMADLKAEREYELAKLEAERQLEQARAARIRAETARSCAEQADRALAACVSK